VYGVHALLARFLPPTAIWNRAALGLIPASTGAVAYFAFAAALDLEELRHFTALLKQRFS